ncbi:MAG TPA: PadR family transcriptional regulator [Pyrinomonadaceae bacterium]|nr:PadR family transcriptional regulator [Pyrinomonadaceae bacterium]
MRETKSRYAILGMLSIAPMSGYDIKKRVEQSVSNFWTESYGQIYPILKSLVAEKLVTKTVEKGAGKPDRHVYALTERGREELQRWLAEGVTPKAERNELLLKLFFGEEVTCATNISHIEQYRELQRGLLERYKAIEKEIKAEYADNSNLPYWLLTVSYGRHVSQALLDWCDESLAKLKKMAKSGR